MTRMTKYHKSPQRVVVSLRCFFRRLGSFAPFQASMHSTLYLVHQAALIALRSHHLSLTSSIMDFMNIPRWYAVTFGAIVVAFIICPAVRYLSRVSMYYFLRYLYYPRPKFLRDKSDATRFDVVLFILLLVVNIICSAVGVHNLSQAIRRTGLMTVVNILPLAMGGHMNLLVDRCKIGLRNYQQIHRSIGRVAILEGLAHSIIALINEGLNWHSTSSIAAIVVRKLPRPIIGPPLTDSFLVSIGCIGPLCNATYIPCVLYAPLL